jgi:hypothetical protein
VTELEQYIAQVSGEEAWVKPIADAKRRLPFYIGEAYEFGVIDLFRRRFLLAILKEGNFTVGQLRKQADIIATDLLVQVILVLPEVDAVTRSRLVEQRVDFICPGKQMFIPSLFLDLKEQFEEKGRETENKTLLPSSQLILLHHFHLLAKGAVGKATSFKELAQVLDYSPMAITKAAEDLQFHDLCIVEGKKEKTFFFMGDKKMLWEKCKPFLGSPVQKTVYVDALPDPKLLKAGEFALPGYTDMNEGMQPVYAVGKFHFQYLQKSGGIAEQYQYEGNYQLEIWKYQPEILVRGKAWHENVDPLSLYLSLRHIKDERIQLALEQIEQKFIYG